MTTRSLARAPCWGRIRRARCAWSKESSLLVHVHHAIAAGLVSLGEFLTLPHAGEAGQAQILSPRPAPWFPYHEIWTPGCGYLGPPDAPRPSDRVIDILHRGPVSRSDWLFERRSLRPVARPSLRACLSFRARGLQLPILWSRHETSLSTGVTAHRPVPRLRCPVVPRPRYRDIANAQLLIRSSPRSRLVSTHSAMSGSG